MLLRCGRLLGYTVSVSVCEGGIPIKSNEGSSKKILLIAGISVAAAALLVFLGMFIWGVSLKNSDRVFPNVCVSGVNIGGMGADEAAQAIATNRATAHAAGRRAGRQPGR